MSSAVQKFARQFGGTERLYAPAEVRMLFLSQDSTEHENTTALSLIVHIQHGVNSVVSYFHTQCCLETKKSILNSAAAYELYCSVFKISC